MAKEYQTTSGGTRQWRDVAAGVQGWNNIDEADEPRSAPKPAAPKPSPVPSMPMPMAPVAPSIPRVEPTSPLSALTALDPTGGASGQQQISASTSSNGLSALLNPDAEAPTEVASQSMGMLRSLGRRTPPSLASLLRPGIY